MTIFDYLKNKLKGTPPVSAVERIMAKRWVKERLKRMYPELRHDPRALEKMYQSLTLEPRPGAGEGGTMQFEIVLPGKTD